MVSLRTDLTSLKAQCERLNNFADEGFKKSKSLLDEQSKAVAQSLKDTNKLMNDINAQVQTKLKTGDDNLASMKLDLNHKQSIIDGLLTKCESLTQELLGQNE